MRELVYDVAVSLDGLISGPGGDVADFLQTGPHVEPYFARLASYATVVMGRATYEIGYAFGLAPGARAYPHMDHHVISATLQLPVGSDVAIVRDDACGYVEQLKRGSGAPIYLCGGGVLAGAMWRAGLIDRLVLKVNPIALGAGVRLFGDMPLPASMLTLTESRAYDNGVVELHHRVTRT